MIHIDDLPSPPPNRSGFPWTEDSPLVPERADLPKISVITPSYNQGAYLEETIRSVLLQGYPKLEYILIDGGSSDDSREIIEKYSDFIDYWVSEADGGQTNAINKGFRRASGDVMGWLNSDDLLLPNSLHQIGKVFAREPETVVVNGFRKNLDADSVIQSNAIRGLSNRYHIQRRNIIAQETVYWRREVWETIGELDENLRFGMDYDYWLRILAGGYDFRLIPHYIGGFRYHDESKTMTLQEVNQRELNALLQKYDIADSQADALAELGDFWHLRYDFAKDLSHQSISDDPRRAAQLLRLMETPIISPPLLLLYKLYSKSR